MKKEEKELRKVEKEAQKALENEHKRIEFEKMQLEIKELKKNYWTKFVIPEIPKWVPAILIAAVSIYITFKSNLFKIQEDKAKVEQEKLVMLKEKRSIEDTISNLVANKNTLYSLINSLKNDTTRMRKKADSIQTNIDFLKISLGQAIQNKAEIYTEIIRLQKEKSKLFTEIKFATYAVKLNLIRIDPNPNCDCVTDIIKEISSNNEFKLRLIDSLFEFRNNMKLFSISSLILYEGLKSENYFTDILNEANYLITKYRNKNDLYRYVYIDSLDFLRFQGAYSILSNLKWSQEKKIIISKLIIDSLFNHYTDNNIDNAFLSIPRLFNSNMDFDLLKLKPGLFFKYIKLNLSLVYADEKTIKNEFYRNEDTLDQKVFLSTEEFDKDLRGSEYFYNRIKSKKTEFLINVSFFCPQIYYSFVTKYQYILFTTRVNKKNLESVEINLYYHLTKNNIINLYPKLKAALESIEYNAYDEKIDNSPRVNSIQTEFESDSGIDLKGVVNDGIIIFNKKYEANRYLIDNWLDENFIYHKKDLKLLDTKLKALIL